MGRPTPETGGGTPQNHGLSEFKPLSKERGIGWGVKKPEEPKQQPAASRWESYDRFSRSTPMRPAVFEGIPPRRHNDKSGQPNPAEQQTPQRRRTQREIARLAQDPELRGLAKELFGGITDQGASEFVSKAIRDYPDLPPDEALRKLDRDMREHPNRGFTFS